MNHKVRPPSRIMQQLSGMRLEVGFEDPVEGTPYTITSVKPTRREHVEALKREIKRGYPTTPPYPPLNRELDQALEALSELMNQNNTSKTITIEPLLGGNEPPLVITLGLSRPHRVYAKGAHTVWVASHLKDYTPHELKTATFLYEDATQARPDQANHQRSLLSALNRATGRKLPPNRTIQIAGFHPEEDNLKVLSVEYRHTEGLPTTTIPATMVVDATHLMDNSQLILTAKRTKMDLPLGAVLEVTRENAGKKTTTTYRVTKLILYRWTLDAAWYGLLPEEALDDEEVDLLQDLNTDPY